MSERTETGAGAAGREFVRVEFPAPRPGGGEGDTIAGVALVILDRPEARNAINDALLGQLVAALERLDADPACRCIVLTGAGERAFAAGADIREMAGETAASLFASDRFARWEVVGSLRTPLVAAVRGFALGGGCEIALSCDIIIAGEDAIFGQPEIKLGIIPGAGGTQRLARAVGRSRAMELILTGRMVDVREAERIGLVSRVVPAAETLATALELAATIAAMPPLAVVAAKEAIGRADELPLREGLAFERRTFYLLFGSEDQREGMAAFLEKRTPTWTGH